MNTMKNFLALTIAVGGTLFLGGCGKEAEDTPTPDTGPAVESPQTNGGEPAATTPQPSTHLTQSQVALEARDYDRAAEEILAMQRSQLSEQQAAAAAAQMRQLQSSLAGAVAAGDPKAIAAAQKLRQASMAR